MQQRCQKVQGRLKLPSMSSNSSDEVPEELEDQCTKCHVALAGIEHLLQSVMAVGRTQMEEKVSFLLMHIRRDYLTYFPIIFSLFCTA